MLLEIINEPNPILKEAAAKITKITPEIEQLAANMIETMYKYNGVGLAAPQVAKQIQMIVFDETPERQNPKVLINPEIVSHNKEKVAAIEGCLSCKGKELAVERWGTVTVKALNLEGKKVTIKAPGFVGRILQHEIDHLHGVLITDIGKKVDLRKFDNQEEVVG